MELKIVKQNALNAFNKADKAGKSLLTELFGKEVFSEKITDRIKTFNDVLASIEISENVATLLKYNGIDSVMIGAQAMAKLTLIAKALNEGWEPDYTNSSQYKYYPWFNNYKSGVGFSYYDYGYDCSITSVGSRLVFKSEELARYAGTQFTNEYNDFLTLNKK